MSLGRLLSSGRSLIGGAPGEGRYNISKANRLPKFGSAKNPFAPSATSEAKAASGTGVSPVLSEEQMRADVGMQTEAIAGRDGSVDRLEACPTTQPDCATVEARIAEFVRHSEEVARASLPCEQGLTGETPMPLPFSERRLQPAATLSTTPLPPEGGVPEATTFPQFTRAGLAATQKSLAALRGFNWRGLLQSCRSKAGAAWMFILRAGPLARVVWEKVKFISLKLAGLIRRREQPEPKPLFPRFGKSVVQAELSLDTIKVVRNTLEDSDLEIVTSETRTGTQIAPSTPVAQPKRGPVPAALKKMTGVIAGPKAG